MRVRETGELVGMPSPSPVVAAFNMRDDDLPLLAGGVRAAAWRLLGRRRCTRISIAVRAAERVLGDRFDRRERGADKTYRVYGNDGGAEPLLVIEIVAPPVHTFADFRRPLRVTVRRPDLVDVDALARRLPGEEVVAEWRQ